MTMELPDLSLSEAELLVRAEVARRRTFAIISHPDAGKTTLTEKFLLYAGQIAEAGEVRGRKMSRAVTSDWMALERERGISVSSTALSFEYRGFTVNLLDTPGHQDFGEDTYRALSAADSAVMVLDAANGVEGQTRKLFRVCVARGVPIITFINKMDRLGKSPLDLLAEIHSELGIDPVAMNWPIGRGVAFRALYDRPRSEVLLFSPTERGALQAPARRCGWADLAGEMDAAAVAEAHDEIALLDGAGGDFDLDRYRRSKQTPVYFGSAATNYGIAAFLDAFVELAPAPGARMGKHGPIPAERPQFAGQVFKIQANLNPHHRDRVAFVRVCCGRFTAETEPIVTRTGERLRVKGAHKLFAQNREAFQVAYPGDVIGLAFTKGVHLGDTLCEPPEVEFASLPRFSPQCFAVVRDVEGGRRKQLIAGLGQMSDEGAIQMFTDPDNSREPILAAVGTLQFDVAKYRLEAEYGVKASLVLLDYRAGAWVLAEKSRLKDVRLPFGMRWAQDHRNRLVVLSDDAFNIRFLQSKEPWLDLRPFGEDLFAPAD